MNNITAIVDLQFGSTGKGLLAGLLSKKNDYDVVVSANMPNAGHTFVDEEGRKWVHKVLPSGVYSKGLRYVAIGPGAVFDPEQFKKEVGYLVEQGIQAEVIIHPHAIILTDDDRKEEAGNLSKIASTMQGSMAAMVRKLRRNPEQMVTAAMVADDFTSRHVVSVDRWNRIMLASKNLLVEGSQGYSLGLNAGFYPYTTSRDCTVHRLLADAGVFATGKLKVIGTARVHPIRVGNTSDGSSGPCYPDQEELTWEKVGQTPETTTVTGRVRRVFTFSEIQIRLAMLTNNVDEVFLNFCNYDPALAFKVAKTIDKIGMELLERRGFHSGLFDPDSFAMVKYMGFGPKASDVLVLPA